MESHCTNTSSSRFLKAKPEEKKKKTWNLLTGRGVELAVSEKDFEGKRLAVAGLTSRDRQQAVRVFTSAPIIKRYDVFTLETADGISIVIRGFLNKFRTTENGFSSEVYSHFLFGFPPYWEEYADEYLGGESTGFVSRRNSGFDNLTTDSGSMKNSSPTMLSFLQEETPNKYKKAITEERHDNGEDILDETNVRLEDNGNILLAKNHCNIHHGACNESSIKVQKECISQNASEKITDDASKGSNLQKHGADLLSHVGEVSVDIGSGVSTSQDKGHPSLTPSPVNVNVDNMKSDASKNCPFSIGSDVNTVNSFEVNIAVPEEPSRHRVTRFYRMDSSKSNRKGNKMRMGKSKGYDVDNVNLSHSDQAISVETSGINLIISSKWPESSKRKQKESKKKKGRLKSESSNLSTVSFSQDPEVGVTCLDENLRGVNSSNLSSVDLEGTQNESLSKTPVVGNPKILELSGNCIDDTMKYPVSGSYVKYKNKECSSTSKECSSTSKAFENPHEEKSKRSSSTQTKIAVGERESDAKGAGTSEKKAKRKLKYDTHVSPLTQEGNKKTSIFSPESFKRSRSGRLLVPTLDFWRNQMAVYDADRQITGIQEGTHVEELSRGSKSKPQKKQTQVT